MALIHINFLSECLKRKVTVSAVVPVDNPLIRQTEQPYKMLVLLHGYNGDYTDWLTKTDIMTYAEEKNLVVIMPSGENKFYVDCSETGDMFGSFIGEELIKVMRRLLPVSPDRNDTFIAGLSMGGYGALVNGLRYPETFGYIACLSTAFPLELLTEKTDEDISFTERKRIIEKAFGSLNLIKGTDKDYYNLINKLKVSKVERPKIYFACGSEDFWLHANQEFVRWLDNQDIDFKFVKDSGNHDWLFWNKYIKKVLNWLP